MPLTSGTRLGPYEVISALGAGGMGEVYRARDTKLGRDVALKVVSDTFTQDPERVARFHREAQLLAALNHPNIATIHGLEDSQGSQFLVMEVVEGGTLADRLTSGALPVPEALAIARQVAAALQAAHEKGIIHRDLKPANIAFSADGQVKVLDFGLAKALESGTGSAIDSPALVTRSPTLSLAATQAGMILGTAAYMAPEQAKGKPADKRSDIWAFGCVLYEMLTGRRAFEGEDASDTMAAVLRAEPEWSTLPRSVPPAVQDLIHGCLAKDRGKRVGDTAALVFVLDHLKTATHDVVTPTRESATRWRRAAAAAVFAVAAGLAGATGAWVARAPGPAEPVVFAVETPRVGQRPESFALSPDGRNLAFAAVDTDGQTRLWVRPLSSATARALPGTEQATLPFWSADSRAIAFFTLSELKRIDLAGGAPQIIARTTASNPIGGTWNAENVILFSRNATGILRVPAAGGTSEAVTTIDQGAGETNHSWPSFLPDGRHFMYLKVIGPVPADNSRLVWRALDEPSERVVRAMYSKAVYSPTGHLLFRLGGPLVAQAFDPASGVVSGDLLQVVPETWSQGANSALAVSPSGLLAYRAGQAGVVAQLAQVDRAGRTVRTIGDPSDYRNPFLDPGGDRVTANTVEPNDVWLFDVRRGTTSRLTFDPGVDSDPVFSPDGRWLAFYSGRQPAGIYRKASNGAGAEELVTATGRASYPRDWSMDGQFLTYDAGAGGGLSILPMSGDRTPVRFPPNSEGLNAYQGHFAPDGKWIAYVSDQTGRGEVFVQEFPATGAKYQVSVAGGFEPRWRRDGRELFFLGSDGRMMAVDVETEPEFRIGIPQPLFQTSLLNLLGSSRRYGVSADGSRFVLNVPVAADTIPPITVIVNWTSLLEPR